MTTFTRTWDATYKGLPKNEDDSSEGASRIRDTRTDVFERMSVDHSWAGDVNDGKHKKLTLVQQSTGPQLDVGDVSLYSKAVGAKSQLFFMDQDGNETQLTFAGQSQFLPAGIVTAYAGSVPPGGFLLCFGQTVSQVTYAGLYAAIGTTYGPAVGGNFTLPDIRGRVIAGQDNMGGVAAGRLAVNISGSTLGAVGGSEQHTITIAEMPSHNHTATDSGHTHTVPSGGAVASAYTITTVGNAFSAAQVTGTGFANVTIGNTGGGGAMSILNPMIIMNYIIKT